VQTEVVAAAEDEKAQKLRAHDSRGVVSRRTQTVADSVEIAWPKTRNNLGLGCAERLEIGEAASNDNSRSSFRSVLVHAPGVRCASVL
jgi:hypothetical protein